MLNSKHTDQDKIAQYQDMICDQEIMDLTDIIVEESKGELDEKNFIPRLFVWLMGQENDKSTPSPEHRYPDRKMGIVEIPYIPSDPEEKRQMMHELGLEISKDYSIAAVTLLTAGWMTSRGPIKRTNDSLIPSKDPARQRCVMCMSMTIDGRAYSHVYLLSQDGDKTIPDKGIKQENAESPLLHIFYQGYLKGITDRGHV